MKGILFYMQREELFGGHGHVRVTGGSMEQGKLRDPLEVINSSSRVKLKADPNPDMLLIQDRAKILLRHHPTLALSTWRAGLLAIRVALENIEDIYNSIEDKHA